MNPLISSSDLDYKRRRPKGHPVWTSLEQRQNQRYVVGYVVHLWTD